MSKRAAGYKYKGNQKGSAKKNTGNRSCGTADAHGQNDWGDVGGSGGSALNAEHVSKGTGSGGGQAYHAAPKSKENVSPKNAHDYASFGGVGGKNKNSNEY